MIVVFGANGQLGSALKEVAMLRNFTDIVFLSSSDCDITKIDDIKASFEKYKPTVVINCAAYTDVNKAEDPKEQDVCYGINAEAVKNIAILCNNLNIKLIYISTDAVFDGKSLHPYTEKDQTNPISVYGKSKLLGEQNALQYAKSVAIVRTNFLYSHFSLKKNIFITFYNLLKNKDQFNVVKDVLGSFCYAIDFAELLLDIAPKIKENKKEIYHFVNYGVVSPYEFASVIKEIYNNLLETKYKEFTDIGKLVKTTGNVNAILAKDFVQIAPRPKLSALDTAKIQQDLGITIKPWKESLERCIVQTIDLELKNKK